jgi:hypothetical protein
VESDGRAVFGPACAQTWGTASLIEKDGIAFLTSEDGRQSVIIDILFSESEIILQVMQLTLFVVAFFADALGKHGTCGWWCLYCFI